MVSPDSSDALAREASDPDYGRRLSYKFQRLRERIRTAIGSGELTGKLPGERVLARKFKVNAKTLSKALTDLAAEGILERSIGLGTFVRDGNRPQGIIKCLVLHDANQADCPIIRSLVDSAVIDAVMHDATEELSPALLHAHRWVIVCSKSLPDEIVRDLVVRGKSVIQCERAGGSYSTHTVMIDRLTAAADLSRRLQRSGHNNLMLVGADRPTALQQEIVAILPASISLRAGALDDLKLAIENGVSGIICTTEETAAHATALLTGYGILVPEQVSVLAMGRINGTPSCTGQYVQQKHLVDALAHLLTDSAPHRPASIWLAGEYIDSHTLAPQTPSRC